MKHTCVVLTVMFTLSAAQAKDTFTEVQYDAFKIAPEDYNSKKISTVVGFRRVSTSLVPYMEKSGMRADKYAWIMVEDEAIPFMAKKSDEMIELLAGLKPTDKIKVSGKVRRFSVRPSQTVHSQYYLLVDEVELVAPGVLKQGGRLPGLPRRRRRF